MSIVISYTAIPKDGIMLSEIDEFISILEDMKQELSKSAIENPDNDYRIFITTEEFVPKEEIDVV